MPANNTVPCCFAALLKLTSAAATAVCTQTSVFVSHTLTAPEATNMTRVLSASNALTPSTAHHDREQPSWPSAEDASQAFRTQPQGVRPAPKILSPQVR